MKIIYADGTTHRVGSFPMLGILTVSEAEMEESREQWEAEDAERRAWERMTREERMAYLAKGISE